VVVMALLVVALRGSDAWRGRLSRRALILGGGIAFPVVALSALLVYSFGALASISPARAIAGPHIEVTGELWWWRVRYKDAGGATLLETANEIHIPVGQPVELVLRSSDVIHSFWVPNLAGKMDMIPGHVNRLRLQAREPGTFRGQCAEFCGAQHARMALYVVAAPPQEHAAWLEAQRQPASLQAGNGRALFEQGRCGACHSIRGTDAAGTLGPDLTHVGSRSTLGAGTIPNQPGAIAAWIAHVQELKPGSRMPAYRQYTDAELQALAGYLAGLR
jgi:cytochrome c oxidase subunit II